MNEKIKYLLIVVGILVFGFLLYYFLATQLNAYEQKIIINNYGVGYKQGQLDFSVTLIKELAQCKPITGHVTENQTITIVAAECLKQ